MLLNRIHHPNAGFFPVEVPETKIPKASVVQPENYFKLFPPVSHRLQGTKRHCKSHSYYLL